MIHPMMGTSKWNMLDHLVRDISRTGGLRYLTGSMYEKAHKIFKEAYARTSKRSQSAMTETIRKQDGHYYIPNSHSKRAVSSILKQINVRRTQAVKEDVAFLVQSGKSVEFIELETAIKIKTTIEMVYPIH